MLFRQILKRRIDIKAVVFGNCFKLLEIVKRASIPTTNCPFRERQSVILNNLVGIKILLNPQTIAAWASAVWVVEREEARL